MRLTLDPRARRLLRRLPRTTAYSAMELVLLSLLAMQCARLAWTIVTPVGPVGEWKAASALRPVLPEPSADLLGTFDPFFRLASTSTAPVVVTSLDLKLFGVLENRASGGGSAIIGTADGQQRSFAVGDEIAPGVVLTDVGFDYVTVTRGGAPEQLFLDQSPPAQVVGSPLVPQPSPPLAAPPPPLNVPVVQAQPQAQPQTQPRVANGQAEAAEPAQ